MEDDFRWSDGLRGSYSLPPGMLFSFLDAVPASVAILDRAANVVAVNAAWKRFCTDNGGDSNAWAVMNYLAVTEATDDDDAQAIGGGLRAVLAGALSSFDHEYPCHGNGHKRWFRCLVAPLTMAPAGPVSGAAVMHVDVTSQRLAESRANIANRAKSDFLASMSHELRTPLNAVIGFSEMLMMEFWGPLDERYKRYAGDIHQAGKHLLSVINEVLDLSKIEAGKFELREEVVNLAEIVPGCIHLVEERAEKAGIALIVDVPYGTPALYADPRLVRQILLNLLSNAVKFTRPGGTITARSDIAGGGGGVRLSVADTGIGIAAADIDRVLEPFGQVDSEQARLYQSESTGLGLALVKRFAELHGGRLSVDSVVGQGTTVSVEFPRYRSNRPKHRG